MADKKHSADNQQTGTAFPDPEGDDRYAICKRALTYLATLADGNGTDGLNLRLTQSEERVYTLPALLEARISTKITERTLQGRVHEGETLGSQEDANRRAFGAGDGAYRNKEVLKEIKKKLEEEKGHGWGKKDHKIPLESYHEIFSVLEACLDCDTTGKTVCRECKGVGTLVCAQCQGQGQMPCVLCRGAQQVRLADGSMGPCAKCAGKGTEACWKCQGQGKAACSLCQGSRSEPCESCGQQGWNSKVTDVRLEALVHFDLDRKMIPMVVQEAVDRIGVQDLVLGEHADLEIAGDEERAEGPYAIALNAYFPYGQATYSIAGNEYEATIAGKKATVLKIAPFLDALLKPGIDALVKAAQGPLATDALFEKARRYRAIRQCFRYIGRTGKKRIVRKLLMHYPAGLSEKYAKAIVFYAEQALARATSRPRYMGLSFGLLLVTLLFIGYYLGPLRNEWLKIPDMSLQAEIMSDSFIAALGFVLTVFFVRIFAFQTVLRLLPPVAVQPVHIQGGAKLPKKKKSQRPRLPPAGRAFWWALAGVTLSFLASGSIAEPLPEWLALILAR